MTLEVIRSMTLSTDLAQQLVNDSSLALCWVNREGRILYINPAFAKFMGRPDKSLLKTNLTRFFTLKNCRNWQEAVERITAGELTEDQAVFQIKQKDVHVHVSLLSVNDDNNRAVSITITRVFEAPPVFGVETVMRRMVDEASIGILLGSRDDIIKYANRAAGEMLGYKPGELSGVKMKSVDPDYSFAHIKNIFDSSQHKGNVPVLQTYYRRRDGSIFPVEITISLAQSKFEDYVFFFIRDISDSIKQQNENDMLRFLMENEMEAVILFNDKHQIQYANKKAENLLGYNRDEILSLDIRNIQTDYQSQEPQEYFKKALKNERMIYQAEFIAKEGGRIPVEVSMAVRLFQNRVCNCLTVRDISERRARMLEVQSLRFALESSSDTVLLFDSQYRVHYANETACDRLGYEKHELEEMLLTQVLPGFDTRMDESIWKSPDHCHLPSFRFSLQSKAGDDIPVEISVSATSFNKTPYAVVFAREISDRIEVEKALKEGEERFRVIADTSPVALVISNRKDGRIQYVNNQAEVVFGHDIAEISTMTLEELLLSSGVDEEILKSLVSGQDIVNREIPLEHNRDSRIWVSLNTRSIELQGEPVLCCALLDVTEARELSNQLSYHATYDDLTGLVNRREFEDRLQEVIDIASLHKTENVLCYLDLDQFKIINDTCGHMAGDEMLRQLSQVLYDNVRKDDTLARLGGDEFAILLEHCSITNAERVANKIRQVVQDFRFIWQGKTFNISVSMGLVPIAQDGETITEILRRADSACYAAKDAGRNRIHVFRFDDSELALRHGEMQWVTRITTAIDEGRLELWKQKILSVSNDGDHLHYELLLRMRDEDGDLILPGAFLPAAERYDLASRIDRWVMQSTFEWLATHPETLERLSMCAINLSGRTLSDAEFLEEVKQNFRKTGVPASKICFEITETAAISNLSNATMFMKTLKDLGCEFALDDFGSGLSSFAYLKNLPVDFVKIDGFFVKDVTTDPIDLAMVKAINDMAHATGKKTIAEFVEDNEILQVLIDLGVDYVQGYGIARPSPLGEE